MPPQTQPAQETETVPPADAPDFETARAPVQDSASAGSTRRERRLDVARAPAHHIGSAGSTGRGLGERGRGRRIDPRGPRFAATLTTVLLAVALLAAPSALTIGLLVAQTLVFGIGAVAGVRRTPYAWVFATLVQPQLGTPQHLEDPAPPRFAQAVGLVFAVLAVAGFATGVTTLGEVATGLALVAALLNAAFGFCLGCEGYLLLRRVLPRSADTGSAGMGRADTGRADTGGADTTHDTTPHDRAGRTPVAPAQHQTKEGKP